MINRYRDSRLLRLSCFVRFQSIVFQMKGKYTDGKSRCVRQYTKIEYRSKWLDGVASASTHSLCENILFLLVQGVFVLLDKVRVDQNELRFILTSSVVKLVASPLHQIRNFTLRSTFFKIAS